MNRWQQFSKDYLTFTRKERIGILCIITIVLIIYLLPRLSAEPQTAFVKADDTILQSIDTLIEKDSKKPTRYEDNQVSYKYEPSAGSSIQGELFVFDPNKLNLEGWKKLGLSERTVNTINNYRTKGGRFYKAEDVQKIWGLPEGFYNRVKNYISIPGKETANQRQFTAFDIKPAKKILNVEVNSADTSAFIDLPGIGGKLANRIVAFRTKLGGFYSINQIAETYGVADSTFQKIKSYLSIDEGKVHKININTATKDELKMHPYIRWNLANAMVEYRNQHGKFTDIKDLMKIALIDGITFEKIYPYLTL